MLKKKQKRESQTHLPESKQTREVAEIGGFLYNWEDKFSNLGLEKKIVPYNTWKRYKAVKTFMKDGATVRFKPYLHNDCVAQEELPISIVHHGKFHDHKTVKIVYLKKDNEDFVFKYEPVWHKDLKVELMDGVKFKHRQAVPVIIKDGIKPYRLKLKLFIRKDNQFPVLDTEKCTNVNPEDIKWMCESTYSSQRQCYKKKQKKSEEQTSIEPKDNAKSKRKNSNTEKSSGKSKRQRQAETAITETATAWVDPQVALNQLAAVALQELNPEQTQVQENPAADLNIIVSAIELTNNMHMMFTHKVTDERTSLIKQIEDLKTERITLAESLKTLRDNLKTESLTAEIKQMFNQLKTIDFSLQQCIEKLDKLQTPLPSQTTNYNI